MNEWWEDVRIDGVAEFGGEVEKVVGGHVDSKKVVSGMVVGG